MLAPTGMLNVSVIFAGHHVFNKEYGPLVASLLAMTGAVSYEYSAFVKHHKKYADLAVSVFRLFSYSPHFAILEAS